jgi:two-component system CheB/CheR fusion protein
MVVIEVKVERQKIFANHIYVLPPGKFMEIKGDYLLLIPRPDLPVNNAINHFLFSLAQDQAPSSTGIILSGEGSDGAEGLKILKEKGGATIAQAPDTAASKSMPIHAIEIGHVDNVLSPKGIATWLGLRRGLYRQGAVQSQGEEGKPRDRCRGDLDNSVHLVQSLANSYNK